MAKNESILEKFKKALSNSVDKTPSESKVPEKRKTLDNPFLFDQDKKYEMVGSGETVTNCPGCGAGYEGPLSSGCSYCGSLRPGAYYREIAGKTPEPVISAKPDIPNVTTSDFPDFGDNTVKLGDSVERLRVVGGIVKIGDYAEINFVGATKKVKLGDSAEISELVAPEIEIGDYFSGESVVGRKIVTVDSATIKVVVIDKKGEAEFGDYAQIETLVVGAEARVSFADSCRISEILTVRGGEIKSGDYFENRSEKEISEAEFEKFREDALESI